MSDQPTTPEPENPDPATRCGGRRPSTLLALFESSAMGARIGNCLGRCGNDSAGPLAQKVGVPNLVSGCKRDRRGMRQYWWRNPHAEIDTDKLLEIIENGQIHAVGGLGKDAAALLIDWANTDSQAKS